MIGPGRIRKYHALGPRAGAHMTLSVESGDLIVVPERCEELLHRGARKETILSYLVPLDYHRTSTS